jgi:hypothetical protein
MALVVLIIIMPVFYSNIQDNITVDVIEMELKEIADYVSNTYENAYFIVNSTNVQEINVTKRLVYLPSYVEDHVFEIRIENENSTAAGITTYLKDRPGIQATAWLSPGMKINNIEPIESGKGIIVVGCYKSGYDILMLLEYEEES